MHHRIKHHTQQTKANGIKYIKIPIDESIPWNIIPSLLTESQWKNIINPEDIKKCIISRNWSCLSQDQGIPFTINPLRDLLGKDSSILFGNLPLLGTVELQHLPLSSLQKLYLVELKNFIYPITSPISRRHDTML